GEGLADLYEALRTTLPAVTAAPANEAAKPAERPINVAVGGRPNSGKSSLINPLGGGKRPLPRPPTGNNRGAIAVPPGGGGQRFRVHDTAGLRRPSRIEQKLEKLSVADTLNAIRFADVVILLMDAQHSFEEQDLRIADLIEREGRALVIGMNKWDLMDGGPAAIRKLRGET